MKRHPKDSLSEVFVFGSNLSGIHGAGAALYARKNHGAEIGVGEGFTGKSYALPTKGYNIEDLPFEDIDAAICRFIQAAKDHPWIRFNLTPVGTGLAGHPKNKVWAVLKREGLPPNVYLTSTWVTN